MLRSKRAKATELTPADLHRRAMKTILLVLILGAVLIACDLILSWGGSGIGIIREGDRIYLQRPDAGDPDGHLRLRASVPGEEGLIEEDLEVTLSPYRSRGAADAGSALSEDAFAEEDLIRSELRGIVSDLNGDRTQRRVLLPGALAGDRPVHWSLRRSSNTLLILALIMIVVIAVYRRRMEPLEKRKREQREAVLRCLPGFLGQIVLLMGAGLILPRAFEQTVSEGLSLPATKDSFFYRQMGRIRAAMEQTNSPLTDQLMDFARGCECREMLRISSIISDNISKGAALSEKLKRESEALWLDRKRRSEERGRLAETKMTLPLAIFLCVLIVVTIAPALIEL